MKKRFNLKNLIGKKNLLLTIVALVLVMLMVVGVSYSWIEQISNVEMTFGEENQAPMHISTGKLNKTAESEINNGTAKTIDLSKYFYESGNMHLSSCYSDGKTFYFPKKVHMGSTDIPNFRLGTKDDANVNYISVSFKLKNTENYDQAYWFYKPGNNEYFFKSTNNTDSNLDKRIRCSFTVDGATSIFSASDSPTYKTVDSITASSTTTNNCQSFKAYQYDGTLTDQSDSGNDNYSSTRGANGNTLFVLPAGTTSTITVKVWLEYDGNNSTASLADVNLKLVSSFTKTRKIYLVDKSLYGDWITGNSATLWLALDNVTSYTYSDDGNPYNDTYWPFTYKDTVNGKKRYQAIIPAYYNNQEAYVLRCSNNGFGRGDTSKPEQKFKTIGSTNYWAWNRWKTTLPDTYDDRTFTEYTPEFGTWNNSVHHFYFIDSWGNYNDNKYSTGLGYAYLWDNNTVADGVKTVANGDWPGQSMYYANQLSVGSISNGDIGGHRVFAVFYDATFTHVIFNNNNNYQTSDLEIPDDIDQYDYFYDLNSNTWYKDTNQVPTNATSVTLHGSWDWNYDRTMYSKDNNVMYAAMYIDSNISEFMVKNTYGGDKYYKHNGNGDNFSQTATWTLKKDGGTLGLNKSSSGIYWFKWKESTKELTVTYPFSASSSSGSAVYPTSTPENLPDDGLYLYGNLSDTGNTNEYIKFSSDAVNGEVSLYLDSLGTYNVKLYRKTGSTVQPYATVGSYQIFDVDQSNKNFWFNSSQTDTVRLRVNTSGTYKLKVGTINNNYTSYQIVTDV